MALCLSGKIYKRDLTIIFAIVVLQTIFEPQWRVSHSVKPYWHYDTAQKSTERELSLRMCVYLLATKN